MFSKQAKVFIAGFCLALCVVAVFLLLQSKAERDRENAVQEAARQEIAKQEALQQEAEKAEAPKREARIIASALRSMASASIMFYADNYDAIKKGSVTIEIEKLKPYVKEKYDSGLYIFEEANQAWWVGIDLKGKSDAVKDELINLAKESKNSFSFVSTTLYGEKNEDVPYTGQDIVWMKARDVTWSVEDAIKSDFEKWERPEKVIVELDW